MRHIFGTLIEHKLNQPESVARQLVKLLQVNISQSTLKKEIEEHPDYPSLLSISDVLNDYGIENLTAKFDPVRYTDLPTPFITQIHGDKNNTASFTVVKEIDAGFARFLDPGRNQWTSLPIGDFLQRSSGIVLLAEAGEEAGEKNYERKVRRERTVMYTQYFIAFLIPTILFSASISIFIQHGVAALLPFLFAVFTMTGGIICVLLLWYEVDQFSPVLQQICSPRKKVNCRAVLQSKGSKIAGVKWSTIGFCYFTGMLLLLLFLGIGNPLALVVVSWVNIMAVPYVIFSVYYQWRVAKQWCSLCLGIQALLILQLITAMLGDWHSLLPFSAIVQTLSSSIPVAFAIPILIVIILLPALQKSQEGRRSHTELQKLKRNRHVFEALLKKQKELIADPNELGILLGNPNASFKLIKVCNPYCGPCANAHKSMEALLQNNPNLQIQILFTATNTENDVKAAPVKHLLAIAANNTEVKVRQALEDWYLAEKKDYDVFAAKYPMDGELNKQSEKIEAMSKWCSEVGIVFTPTFFVSIPNDHGTTTYYQLPKIYRINDLKYFISM